MRVSLWSLVAAVATASLMPGTHGASASTGTAASASPSSAQLLLRPAHQPAPAFRRAPDSNIAPAIHDGNIASAIHDGSVTRAKHDDSIAPATHDGNIVPAKHDNSIAPAAHNSIASAAHNSIDPATHDGNIAPATHDVFHSATVDRQSPDGQTEVSQSAMTDEFTHTVPAAQTPVFTQGIDSPLITVLPEPNQAPQSELGSNVGANIYSNSPRIQGSVESILPTTASTSRSPTGYLFDLPTKDLSASSASDLSGSSASDLSVSPSSDLSEFPTEDQNRRLQHQLDQEASNELSNESAGTEQNHRTGIKVTGLVGKVASVKPTFLTEIVTLPRTGKLPTNGGNENLLRHLKTSQHDDEQVIGKGTPIVNEQHQKQVSNSENEIQLARDRQSNSKSKAIVKNITKNSGVSTSETDSHKTPSPGNNPTDLSDSTISTLLTTRGPEEEFRKSNMVDEGDRESKTKKRTKAGSVETDFDFSQVSERTGIGRKESKAGIRSPKESTGNQDANGDRAGDSGGKKALPTETAVLKLDRNSSKLIGYADDPFHVSDTLRGESRNVEVVQEGNARAHGSKTNRRIIDFMQNSMSRKQQSVSDASRDGRTNEAVHGRKVTVDSPNVPVVGGSGPAPGIADPTDVRPVAEFRGLDSGPAKIQNDDVLIRHSENSYNRAIISPPAVVEQSISRENGSGTSAAVEDTVQSSTKESSDGSRVNVSEIIEHEGISYIRKNFLIMPLYDDSSQFGQIPNTDIETTTVSSAAATTTTEISLLNQRVPIYQEIAGAMHIDSSIDDTLDADEPITPDTEKDDDEIYLPLANSSVVNLVDPSVVSDPNDSSIKTGRKNSLGHEQSNITSARKISDDAVQQQLQSVEDDSSGHEETARRRTSKPGEEDSGSSEEDPPNSHHGKHDSFVLKQKAELMSSLLDSSADPCQDFYQYACGGWSTRFTLRPDQAVDNTFERLRDDLDSVLVSLLEEASPRHEPRYTSMAKTLYRGCMDVEAIEAAGTAPLLELLEQLGGWPVLEGDSWDASSFDLTLQMALLRTLNNEVLLAETVAFDVLNSSRRIVQLDQPKLGLPGRNYYLSNSDQKYRDAYLNLMLRACHLLGADPLIAMRDMADVLFFETELAKLLVPAEERRNLSAIHRRYSRDELKQQYPGISWDVYLDTIAPNHIPHTQDVRLFCHGYLHDLLGLLNSTEPRTVSNYLLWRLVKNRLGNLGSQALEVKQEYIRVLFGRSTQPNRWRSCITYVNGNLGGIVGSMFVARYFPEESRRDTEEMISLIREAFGASVREADWMLPETRDTASGKVQAIVWNVGYPHELLNDTHMEEKFGQLEFSPRSHFSNVLSMLRYHSERSHALLGTPVNRTTWAASPATVNAYYSRTKNMIMFPAGILQPPFYHPAYPRALNYGGIGVVIGHEISHGFDDGGRQFDKRGNLKQWWSKKDVLAFYARATCMLEQYSRFEVPELGMPVNAITTLGENIADNAGLNIAYTAYQKWLSHNTDTSILPHLNLTLDQLFFLNFGQIWCEVNTPEAALTNLRSGRHSPNRYRVIGTLSNSAAFSKAFQCPVGSPMHPADKCAVW